jgi:hypothetical protein
LTGHGSRPDVAVPAVLVGTALSSLVPLRSLIVMSRPPAVPAEEKTRIVLSIPGR